MTDEHREEEIIAAEQDYFASQAATAEANAKAQNEEPLALADEAFQVAQSIHSKRTEIARNFLELGRLFKVMRDQRLYAALDCESFDEFLGTPEIAFRRSTAYNLIHLYEVCVERLKVDPEFLASVGVAKLQVVLPVVADDPDNWLFKAKELSRADLITEVRVARGREDKGPAAKPPADWVCPRCGWPGSDKRDVD